MESETLSGDGPHPSSLDSKPTTVGTVDGGGESVQLQERAPPPRHSLLHHSLLHQSLHHSLAGGLTVQ